MTNNSEKDKIKGYITALSQFTECANPFALPIYLVSGYKGFEIWKSIKSKRGEIYFRYTDWGNPYVFINDTVVMKLKRMVVVKTPFTSVDAFKEFVRACVKE